MRAPASLFAQAVASLDPNAFACAGCCKLPMMQCNWECFAKVVGNKENIMSAARLLKAWQSGVIRRVQPYGPKGQQRICPGQQPRSFDRITHSTSWWSWPLALVLVLYSFPSRYSSDLPRASFVRNPAFLSVPHSPRRLGVAQGLHSPS